MPEAPLPEPSADVPQDVTARLDESPAALDARSCDAPDSDSSRVRLVLPSCGFSLASFADLAPVLRVELRSVEHSVDVVADEAEDSLSVDVRECTDLSDVVLRARRGDREEVRHVDLRDSRGAAGVRTLALLPSDVWQAAMLPAAAPEAIDVAPEHTEVLPNSLPVRTRTVGLGFEAIPRFGTVALGVMLHLDWHKNGFRPRRGPPL